MHDPGGLVDRTGWNIARKDTDSLGEMLSGIQANSRKREELCVSYHGESECIRKFLINIFF